MTKVIPLPNLTTPLPRFSYNHLFFDLPDQIILENCVLFSFIATKILLVKAFLILAFCLVVRNNSCGKSSSWEFFLVNLSILLFFFPTDLSN